MDDFKKCLQEHIVVYINKQKVLKLSSAAVLVDEFVLTHRTVFSWDPEEKSHQPSACQSPPPTENPKKRIECFYGHKPGHLISNCLTLKCKQQSASNVVQPKDVGLIKTEHHINVASASETTDTRFEPFVFEGRVSLTNEPKDQHSGHILRDTGASQSIILADVIVFFRSLLLWLKCCLIWRCDRLYSFPRTPYSHSVQTSNRLLYCCCLPCTAG